MKTLLLVLGLFGQDDSAKAKELVEAAAAAMKDAPAIAFDCQSTWKGMEVTQKLKLQLKRPDLARIDISWQGQDYLYVLDGKIFWMYQKSINQYMQSPQMTGMLDQLGAGPVPSLYLNKSAETLLQAVGKLSRMKEKLGEEECDVVGWTQEESESRLWIDAQKTIRRYEQKMKFGEETYEQTVEYGKIDLAPKPADDAFTFTPPKDSKEMTQPGEDDTLLAEGSDAPDFEVTDLEGKTVKLSDFKGKVVLLNFWFYD